jgi:ABC-2 type transport system ATP-binding protein
LTKSLEIDGLSKRFGDVIALQDVRFDVHAGEIFGFVGGNGAGKTTTMRIALGVLEADSGSVRWDGTPVDLNIWRRIGYMPEERGLYPKMKVGEQLMFLAELHGLGRSDADAAVHSWLERLGVAHRIDDELQKLSLGNQQRVQLAAALVHEPEVLILDEPFSGLDPIAVDVMSDVLRDQCAAGVPVLFSSHQLDLVQRLCDRVGIIDHGEMVAVGTVDELRNQGDARLVIHLDGAQPGWASNIPGVHEVSTDHDTAVLRLDDGADDQQVLQAAMHVGAVHEFGMQRPTLAELFRHVVSEQEDSVSEARS